MIVTAILASLWSFFVNTALAFWPWLVGGAGVVLAFLFSPAIRKYTLALIATLIIVGAVFLWGYNSNHNVEIVTHTCQEFRDHLVSSPATDKAIAIFKRNGLCV